MDDDVRRLFGIKQQVFDELFQGPKGSLILVEYVICLLTTLYLIIVLEALVKVNFLPGYRRFLFSLALSDLYTLFIHEAAFIYDFIKIITPAIANSPMEPCGSQFLRNLKLVGFFTQLFNLAGMSTDHFIGAVYPGRYRELNNKRLSGIAVTAIWIISFVLGFADVPVAGAIYVASLFSKPGMFFKAAKVRTHDFSQTSFLAFDANSFANRVLRSYTAKPPPINQSKAILLDLKRAVAVVAGTNNKNERTSSPAAILSRLYEELNVLAKHKPGDRDDKSGWCTIYMALEVWLDAVVLVLTVSCLIVLLFCYIKTFKEVFNYRHSLSRLRYSRTPLIVTTCALLLAFSVCWLPWLITNFCLIIFSDKHAAAMNTAGLLFTMSQICGSLTYCYPFINAVIFANRVRIVRRFIFMKYCHFFPCCRTCGIEQVVRTSSTRGSSINEMIGPAGFINDWSQQQINPTMVIAASLKKIKAPGVDNRPHRAGSMGNIHQCVRVESDPFPSPSRRARHHYPRRQISLDNPPSRHGNDQT